MSIFDSPTREDPATLFPTPSRGSTRRRGAVPPRSGEAGSRSTAHGFPHGLRVRVHSLGSSWGLEPAAISEEGSVGWLPRRIAVVHTKLGLLPSSIVPDIIRIPRGVMQLFGKPPADSSSVPTHTRAARSSRCNEVSRIRENRSFADVVACPRRLIATRANARVDGFESRGLDES